MRKFDALNEALRIESQRLYLRPITKDDTELVLSMRNADYVRNVFFYRVPITYEEHLNFFESKCQTGQVFYFLVCLKDTDEPIGCVYLQHYDEKEKSLESGVFFKEDAPKGKGYATEALKLMNAYAFKEFGVSKTVATVIKGNKPSEELHKRVGFNLVAEETRTIIPSGEKVKALIFELFERDLQEEIEEITEEPDEENKSDLIVNSLNNIKKLVFVVLLLALNVLLLVKNLDSKKVKDTNFSGSSIRFVEDGSYFGKESGLTAWDAVEGGVNPVFVLAPSEIKASSYVQMTEKGAKLVYQPALECSTEDIITVQFTAYTDEGAADLNIKSGSIKRQVYVSETPVSFYITFSNISAMDKIEFLAKGVSEDVAVNLEDTYIVNWGNSVDIRSIQVGTLTRTDFDEKILSAENIVVSGSSTETLVDGSILYTLGKGTLTSYMLTEDGAVYMSEVSGMGAATNTIAFNEDKTAILVSAGLNGLYLINIIDPANLSVYSHYDTLDSATGIYVASYYAFVCDRYFGIELVDISQPENPRYITRVTTDSEYADCYVADHFLYASVKAEKRVDIFDIADTHSARLLTQIALDGEGDGLVVRDNILYVATAFDSANIVKSIVSYGAGTGNGLEIYDVTSPSMPEKLSVVKFDGRMNEYSTDKWDVQVSGNYAYVANVLNGMYVIDISDLKKAKVVERYLVETPAAEIENFTDIAATGAVYPYDTATVERGAVSSITLSESGAYISVDEKGVYCIDMAEAYMPEEEGYYAFYGDEFIPVVPEVEGYVSELYESTSSIYSVAVKDGYIYVAAGERGIVVLDNNMTEVNVVPANGSVKDVKIYGDVLFTAESSNGVSSYRVSGPEVTFLSNVDEESPNAHTISLAMTEDGAFIVAQISQNRHMVVNAKNPESLYLEMGSTSGTGAMKGRNAVAGLSDGYAGISGASNTIWYRSVDGALESIKLKKTVERSGIAGISGGAIAVTGDGYRVFGIDGGYETKVISVPGFTTLSGKPSVGGDVMVVSNGATGAAMLVDIKDIQNPIGLTAIRTTCALDVAVFDGDTIYIPCRYGGLLRLSR